MSVISTPYAAAPSLGGRIVSAVIRFADHVATRSQANRCRAEAERLAALSDEELNQIGLAREDIVGHAFRRYLYM